MSVVVEEVSAERHRELRDGLKRVKDLFRPNPAVYWSDLLTSLGVGWGAFAACPANLKSEIREAFTSWWKATGR